MLDRLGVQHKLFLKGVDWLIHAHNTHLSRRNKLLGSYAKYLLQQLDAFDAIIVADHLRVFHDDVDFEPIRTLKKPIAHYDVFFIGGSSHWLSRLPNDAEEKFDLYFTVSGINDDLVTPKKPVYTIGMDCLPHYQLDEEKPYFALLDFPRSDYEDHRDLQKRILEKLGIKYFELTGEFTFKDIEKIYSKAAAYFLSFPESFGFPIVQNQMYGAHVFSPSPTWVKRHTLAPDGTSFLNQVNPIFSDNFLFYSEDTLERVIVDTISRYSPNAVRNTLLSTQPQFCTGNLAALWSGLTTLLQNG